MQDNDIHFLTVGMVATLAGAAFAAGPRTPVAEFLSQRIDTSIPELSGIPAQIETNDVAGAEKAFADYVRANLRTDIVCSEWARKEYTPAQLSNLTARAETVMDYRLSSCGTEFHFADHKVDWESNPTYNNYKEWTWQLNRHSCFTPLAEYYFRTGDERAVTVWLDMMDSWLNQALAPDPGTHPHATKCWRTIDTGIRAGCWVGQFAAFARSPQVSDAFITRYCTSVWEHGQRLRANTTSGNWLIIELGALMHISMVYPFLGDAAAWGAYAARRQREEMERQVYPDGFQYELTTAYHGGVTGDYRNIARFHERFGHEPPAYIRENLAKMFEVYMYLCTPGFVTPNLNDGEEAFVPRHCARGLEFYPDREDFRWFATLGRQGRPPDFLSLAMPYAGAVVFRDSWRRDAVWAYMDASPFGHAHQHEDKLNFLLWAYGRPMLVEGGNYFYDTSEMRKYVLSTRAHNTIRIDGQDQNTRRTYRWRDDDIKKKADLSFSTTPGRDRAQAAFTAGYGPQGTPVVHDRTVVFVKDEKGLPPFFVVADRLTAKDGSRHAFQAIWHLASCNLAIDGATFTGDFGKGLGLFAATSAADASITNRIGQKKPELQGWLPVWDAGPHKDIPIPTPVVEGAFTGARRIVTVFCPYRDGKSPIVGVRASDDTADTALTLLLADGTERNIDEGVATPETPPSPSPSP